ncbi:type VII secretion EssA family protein [Bacillus sp. FSL W7-1360]
MKLKRLIVCFGAMAMVLAGLSPLSFGAEESTRTNPAEYQTRDIQPDLKDNTAKDEKQEPVPEEVNQLKFNQSLEQEYNEMVGALSLNGEDAITTEIVASHIGLFNKAITFPQKVIDDEGSSVAWLPWVLGTVVAGLLVTLFVYILPKGFSMTEQ